MTHLTPPSDLAATTKDDPRQMAANFMAMAADRRLVARAGEIISRWRKNPGVGFPQIFEDEAENEALYRFFNNAAITFDILMSSLVAATCARIPPEGDVVVAHDTTEFSFKGAKKRQGLGRLNTKDQGFLGHFAVAVDAQGTRRPYGPLGAELYTRQAALKGRRETAKRRHENDKESARWGRLVDAVEEQLAHRRVIHAMDREADIYSLLADCVSHGRRFVIRCSQDRCVGSPDDETHRLFEVVETLPELGRITVHVSPRPASSLPGRRKSHPERKERDATLSLHATTVELLRPARASAAWPERVQINVVRAVELTPPDGEERIEWLILTTESIASYEDVLRVTELYRCRWVIEEFFKALKTGCAIEKRQLESFHALSNALAMAIPIACEMLTLRSLAATAPQTPACHVVDPLRIQVLTALAKRYKLGPEPTVQDVLYSIAGMGGHFKRNGNPGWLTLRRGYARLLTYEEAWLAALETQPNTRRLALGRRGKM